MEVNRSMGSILDIMKKRVSVRTYQDKSVPDELIHSLLEAARYSPSARNLQQLEYKVITNRSLITRISDSIAAVLERENSSFPRRVNYFYEAPLLIVVTGPQENAWIFSDAGLAAENIMLCATENNLGSCFIGMARLIERDQSLLRELHVSEGHKIAAAVICGYANEKPAIKEKKMKAEYFV
jgi:nitroreductase